MRHRPLEHAPAWSSELSSLVSTMASTSARGAASEPTRQLGARIFEKPET